MNLSCTWVCWARWKRPDSVAGACWVGLLQWIVRSLHGSAGHALGWGFVVAAGFHGDRR